MKVAVLGGTRGIGRATCRQLVSEGHDVFLLGRSEADLQKSSRDLTERSGRKAAVHTAVCDLEDPTTFESALSQADQALGGLDAVLVTAGLFATQDQLEKDRAFAYRVLSANYAGTVIFCEHARDLLLKNGGGTLCVLSSVAGERGRKPVILYGSSKAGLSAYLEGLDHKFRAQGLRTVCIKPGFVRTAMTEGLSEPPFAADPEKVALAIVQAMKSGIPVRYTPGIWALIMLLIRHLPRFVMRRIGF